MISEAEKKYIKDTIIHKSYILIECNIMFDWLCENGKENLAINLAKSCSIHDDSKFTKLEYTKMLEISMDSKKDAMLNPSILPSNYVSSILKYHWKNNRHHPEHFKDPNLMTELDMIEMVCDWSARSQQYKTDLLEFVNTRLQKRFTGFNEENKKLILQYCNVLMHNRV